MRADPEAADAAILGDAATAPGAGFSCGAETVQPTIKMLKSVSLN
jgi:hypothetical protein